MAEVMVGSKIRPNEPIRLDDEWVLKMVGDDPNCGLTNLGKFVFYSKYSRYREDVKRREYYSETAQRATEYNVNLAIAHLEDKGLMTPELRAWHMQELKDLYLAQTRTQLSLSGRTLWIGGTPSSYSNPMSNFNCSFMVLNAWEKLGELIHLGMVGSGIGFRILQSDVELLKPLKARNWSIVHKPYDMVEPEKRKEHSYSMYDGDNKRVTIVIGDSKEGWRESIDLFFDILATNRKVKEVAFDYDNIRPAGEPLKRFGGRAGGHETIKAMFDTFHKIITGTLDEGYPKMAGGRPLPIHMLDFANAIGKNIVSGDVRSIAEIGLLDPDDKDTIEAKSQVFSKKHLNHRYVSNNSVYYLQRPTDEQFDWQFEQIQFNGEPCFVNAELGGRRRPNFNGVNPCVEILLDDRGLCNLTTINMMAFAKGGEFDLQGMINAFALATRAGLRMTLPKLEIEEWDFIQQRDRLLGVSVTGWQDFVDALEIDDDIETQKTILKLAREIVHQTATEYAKLLGVNTPLLMTCVKPEGTISQLFGGVSSGLHVAHASEFIRRVRTAQKDPITKAVFEHKGWKMASDFFDGSQHDQIEEFLQYVSEFVTTEPIDGNDSLIPIKYDYLDGKLDIEFKVRTRSGEDLSDSQMASLLSTIDLFYDGRVKRAHERLSPDRQEGFIHIAMSVEGLTYEEVFGKTKKVVVDFPNTSPARRTKSNFPAIKQLEVYKMFLENYTDHNPSNTISVRENEWGGVKQWVKDNWDSMLAVSFLSLYDTPYPLQPFEETTKEVIDEMNGRMEDFNVKKLWAYDLGEDMEVVEGSCENGHCPVR